MSDFLEELKNIENPEIINGINSGDPYIICDLLEKTGGGMYLKALEDAIIKTNDIVQIYEFLFLAINMNITGFDQERFEEIIRKSGNPKLMCYCLGFVPGTNIEEMMVSLIQTHNTKYLAMLLDNEEYADVFESVKKIFPNYEEIVEDSKQYNFYPNSLKKYEQYSNNIEQLKEHIKTERNPHLITELANYIEYLNEYKDGNYSINDLISLQSKLQDPMQSYEFLASVNLNEEERSGLIKAVIDSKKAKFIYYVLEYVPELTDKEKDKLKDAVLLQDAQGKYGKIIKDKEEVSK